MTLRPRELVEVASALLLAVLLVVCARQYREIQYLQGDLRYCMAAERIPMAGQPCPISGSVWRPDHSNLNILHCVSSLR